MKIRSILSIARLLVVLLPFVTLTSCASKMMYGANRARLLTAEEHLSRGENAQAAAQMEKLLTQTVADERSYALQRFAASYLLARAHMEASFGTPFLESAATDQSGFRMGSGGAGGGSSLANLVASTYYASYGRNWFSAASKAPTEVKGEQLLTDALASMGTRNAMMHLNLVLLTAYAKLNFQDRIEFILGEMSELQQLEQCDQVLANAQAGTDMNAWVYRGVFDYLRKRDEIAAYKFGVRVLDLVRKDADHDPTLDAGIAKWITEDSKYIFRCPSCTQTFDPALPGCTVCRRPNLEFEPEERAVE